MSKNSDFANKWDEEYISGKLGGELSPDYAISSFHSLIPKGNVLDIGGGEGRNALYLASKGYNIRIVDCSSVAIERCKQAASRANISIETEICDS